MGVSIFNIKYWIFHWWWHKKKTDELSRKYIKKIQRTNQEHNFTYRCTYMYCFLAHCGVLLLSRWSVGAGGLCLCHRGTVSARRNGSFSSWPTSGWDLCWSKPRHGGHWYPPHERSGYPKVITAPSQICFVFVLFVLLMISLGISFQIEDNAHNHFEIFVPLRQATNKANNPCRLPPQC